MLIYQQLLAAIVQLPVGTVFTLDRNFYIAHNITSSKSDRIKLGKKFRKDVLAGQVPKVARHMFRACNFCGDKNSDNKRYYEKI